MQFSAAQIAGFINAQIEGNPEAQVKGFNNIEAAKENDLSFLANPKYETLLYKSEASVVIVNKSLVLKSLVTPTLLRVDDPYAAFATLLKVYEDMRSKKLNGIQVNSYVDETAEIGEDVYIGSFSYISEKAVIGKSSKIYPGCFVGENVQIGENTILYPGVKVYHQCILGNNIIVHAGAVIGADGFGFTPQRDGSYQKVPQIGHVIIEDNVEIGANTTIDRATLNATIIRKGVKIDNLVQIAHNVELGQNTGIAAQAGISGSTKIGKNVMIAGQAGIAGHLEIDDKTIITAQSGIGKSVKTENSILSGSPAFDHSARRRSEVVYRHLPELEKRILELEKLVKELSKQ
ncbi:UDP-3-O-(3-hydroxymyristoyl)glucosamine N-acyltransferase [Arachidicoccus sp.]|jgi:UDP-3-O-[3-hydroxymyristoyl] glucosamine N-acyltransferase|uniref:UDP-3-O-(3-hydroxymyristoyl)glucosamine N-acyltransferase n=1 Tax=Arachidicoccus sp. TaxID=1872624 RepID=UPI003D23D53C